MRKTIIFSQTFPYGGETFLQAEIELLPNGWDVDIWPFVPPKGGSASFVLKDGITVHPILQAYSLSAKGRAILCSLRAFISRGEWKYACQKRHAVRNILKAIKFAYISELRVGNVAAWLRAEKAEVEHLVFYAYWMYETAYVAARLKELMPGSKFVTRCHGYDLYEERHPNEYVPYRRMILAAADLICPVSQKGKDYLSARYQGKYDFKIEVMRLGTMRRIAPRNNEKDSKTVIVSCSNLIPLKRVEKIIDALACSKRELSWYHFGDGPLRMALEKQSKSLPANIEAHFMGFIPNENVQEFYATHTVGAFLNVSESEGVPVSIMEAQSYGIPVIATDVGGTAEIVHDRQNGVLLDSDFSSEDLLRALEIVLNNREAMGKKAVEIWETKSDARETTRQFYERLEGLEGEECRDFL